MKKRIIGGLFLAGAASVALASCGSSAEKFVGYEGDYVAPSYVNAEHEASTDGEIFHIYAWNTEFQGFFNKYCSDEGDNGNGDISNVTTFHKNGKEVKWTIVPSDNGAYQEALDRALMNNATADEDSKVDMFLGEADYILKYTNSAYTYDITKIGVTDFSNVYSYTKEAASDSKGVVKGVSFQCCPSAMIYRRSIAQDVLGTDDPEAVQAAVSDWTKFDSVAAQAKAKGYYMTASYAATYRVFSNNTTKAWVTSDTCTLQWDSNISTWMQQAKNYVDNGYTLTSGIWDDETTAQMYKTGKAMCYFGPAWYYNFSMGNAQDEEKGCYGDWAICQGPQAHFWGGTWMLAATGGDNDTEVADTMNQFINDKDTCLKLVENEAQFSNNQEANAEYAATGKGNAFLGGQNDTAIFLELAKNIKFQNQTVYDQYCNEGLQTYYSEYLKGSVSYVTSINNFYSYLHTKCADITTLKVDGPTIK